MTVPDTLFRQEVVDFQQLEREWGQIALPQPVSTRIMTWGITAAIALLVVFLCLAQYARKETVVGYLTLSNGRAKVFAPQQGIIKNVYVKEGDQVVEGQPLFTVETAQISSEGRDVNVSMLNTLNGQRDLLARQVKAEEGRALSERARLVSQIKGLQLEISNLETMARIQNDRIQIFRKFVESAEQLKQKGYGSDVEFRRRQQELLEQEQNLNSLNQQQADRGNQLNEAQSNLQQLPILMAQKVQLLRNQLSEVEQRIDQVNSRRAYNVRAPTAGRVSSLQAMVGQTADPQYLQLEIIPTGSVLQAELFIPTRAIGFVEVGRDVRLLYDAFPYQKFGTYRGRIVQLSKTVVTNSDIRVPVTLREPAYRAIATLELQHVNVDDKAISLQADMLLTADIMLDKRAILSWLFNPLLGARHVFDFDRLSHSWHDWIDQLWSIHRFIKVRLVEAGVLKREASVRDAENLGHL